MATNQAHIRSDARGVMRANAAWLRANPNAKVRTAGNCDERGTIEYNQALGQRRAQNAKKYLTDLGISAGRISLISYGKENRPAPRTSKVLAKEPEGRLGSDERVKKHASFRRAGRGIRMVLFPALFFSVLAAKTRVEQRIAREHCIARFYRQISQLRMRGPLSYDFKAGGEESSGLFLSVSP